ncbi:MAG: PEGA domain-containing protein [Candidatus Omnitrophota bacterium]
MQRMIAAILIVVLCLPCGGCATIVDGKTQDVMIRSTPAGATVTIDEIAMGTTPMVANLVRKKRHSIFLTKAGYQDVSQATTRGFNWWYLGNLIFGGIIGLIVDPCTGAIFKVEPDEINVGLPSGAGSADTVKAQVTSQAADFAEPRGVDKAETAVRTAVETAEAPAVEETEEEF